MPDAASGIRYARGRVAAVESLNTLLGAWQIQASSAATSIAAAYEGSFLYSEHTWGASSREYSPRLYGDAWKRAHDAGKYKYAEESWEEHFNYIKPVFSGARPIYRELSALAQGIRVEGPRIVVFNPLPWTRGEAVTAWTRETTPHSWQDAATGGRVAVDRRVFAPDGQLLILAAADIPPLGYRTYVPVPGVRNRKGTPPGEGSPPNILENEFFRVHLDAARGVIRSVIDKRSGRELVDQKSEYGFGQYLYERFDKSHHTKFINSFCKSRPGWVDEFGRANLPPASEVPYRAASPKPSGVTELMQSEEGANGVRSTVGVAMKRSALVPDDVQLEVTLYRGQPFVDLSIKLGTLEPDPWPQASWVCLPFAVDEPSFRLGRPGSVIDPAKDIVRSANFEMFCLDSGLTITGSDEHGVGLCAMDSFLVSLGRPGAFRFSREWSPRKPTVFVNLYNNIWGTNFRQWTDEVVDCRVRIWSVEGKGIEADLITPAWEARSPLVAAYADGPAGTLPPVQAGIELSRKGVLVTAFGPSPDGEGILLRLWEQAGQGGVCEVKLPEAMRGHKARLCDLRGRPMDGQIAIRDGVLDVPLTRFAPTSIVLTQ